jgi:CDP-2,3-bis-(O-geranylgeranyl)-sn-glycerol synthase
MNSIFIIKALLLLLVANGAPILARRIFDQRFNQPIDGGIIFFDGKPILGPKKTYRGLIASIIMTSLAAVILNLPAWTGTLVALFSMLGDLLSSFTKRRLGFYSSDKSLGIDQIPESLLPLWLLHDELGLNALDVLVIVVTFFFLGLFLSRILFYLNIRDRPH